MNPIVLPWIQSFGVPGAGAWPQGEQVGDGGLQRLDLGGGGNKGGVADSQDGVEGTKITRILGPRSFLKTRRCKLTTKKQ